MSLQLKLKAENEVVQKKQTFLPLKQFSTFQVTTGSTSVASERFLRCFMDVLALSPMPISPTSEAIEVGEFR